MEMLSGVFPPMKQMKKLNVCPVPPVQVVALKNHPAFQKRHIHIIMQRNIRKILKPQIADYIDLVNI
jgi:hypothetical protein